MKRLYLLVLLLGSMGISLNTFASDESDFKAAESSFMQALDGDSDALEQSIDGFQELLDKDPEHPAYRAYLGASIALQSREAWMPWNKMKFSEQGLSKIDEALKMLHNISTDQKLLGVPTSLQTKYIAAATFIGMPDDIFHRHRHGIELLRSIVNDNSYKATPDSFKAAVMNSYSEATHE